MHDYHLLQMKTVRFTVGNDDFSRINLVTVSMDQIESFRYKMGSIISPMMQTFYNSGEDATKLKVETPLKERIYNLTNFHEFLEEDFYEEIKTY